MYHEINFRPNTKHQQQSACRLRFLVFCTTTTGFIFSLTTEPVLHQPEILSITITWFLYTKLVYLCRIQRWPNWDRGPLVFHDFHEALSSGPRKVGKNVGCKFIDFRQGEKYKIMTFEQIKMSNLSFFKLDRYCVFYKLAAALTVEFLFSKRYFKQWKLYGLYRTHLRVILKPIKMSWKSEYFVMHFSKNCRFHIYYVFSFSSLSI